MKSQTGALTDPPVSCLEIYPAGVKLPDVDYRGGEGQGDVFLPQEIVSPSLGVFEVMRINGAAQTLSGCDERSARVSVRSEWVVCLSQGCPDDRPACVFPGCEVDNVATIDVVELRCPHVVHSPGWPGVDVEHPGSETTVR